MPATKLELRFAEAGAKLGLLDRPVIEQALTVVETLRDSGMQADLRTVLISRRKLDPEDGDRILAAMARVAVYCPVCHGTFAAEPWAAGLTCPTDSVPVKPTLAPAATAAPAAPAASSGTRAKPDTRAVNDPLIGKRFGEFELTGLVEKTDAHKVYAATLPGSPADTAVSFLARVLTSNDRMIRRRFVREARYVGLIDHPNVVGIVASGEQDDWIYMISEFMPGQPVSALMASHPEHRGRLDTADALRIMAATLDGLAAAHEFGVVHRNLKPSAIMVDGASVKLTGFGKARIEDDSQVSEKLTVGTIGTPHYMAPEQIETSAVDHLADVYSAGATLYHMLCGQPPYKGRDSMEIIQAVMRTEPPAPSSVFAGVPLLVERTIQKMMARKPAQRIQSAREAAAELRAGLV
ncbi:MAG: serine/threonine-protein kinase [Planctomycetota bacterium]